ncbi:hypothetical protein PZA11_004910 [Diplocarpon coronariae]
MADLDSPALAVDDRPLAVRRQRRRRRSIGPNASSSLREHSLPTLTHGMASPPATPTRRKKKVRFSDPGPAIGSGPASSGLTPFLRRTSLTTPRAKPTRRPSTPGSLWNRAGDDVAPACGTLQFAPLRQVLEGRVVRRLRRNRLSEEVNTIEGDKRAAARERQSEIERLKGELAVRDLEVQSMRVELEGAAQLEGESGGSVAMTATLRNQVRGLEQEIRFLQEELSRREGDGDTIVEDGPDWTMAARDPYDAADDEHDDGVMATDLEQELHEMSGHDEILTTPTRLNTSFPSPPSTMPNTPCRPGCTGKAGIQASSTPDRENDALRCQLGCLQSEVKKLTSAIAFDADHRDRLAEKLSSFMPAHASPDPSTLDAALDSVLTTLALSQSEAREHSTAFAALATEISSLGFPARGPDESLSRIAAQFRRARLELESLAPGEVAAGFENAKLLGLLVERIRVLLARVRQQDASIDQYHAQEVLLRQQLNDRVSVTDALQRELRAAATLVSSLRSELSDAATDGARLRAALDGYRDEVASLEQLVQRLEQAGRENDEARLASEASQHAVLRAVNEGNEMLLAELERRLAAALGAAAELEGQLAALASTQRATAEERDAARDVRDEKSAALAALQSSLQSRERSHGAALTLRDARVAELRREIERLSASLEGAHAALQALRAEKADLVAKEERAQMVVRDMLEQLGRAGEMGLGFVDEGAERGRAQSEGPVVVSGGGMGMLDAGLARRRSGSWKAGERRRYDSGLGFLEEEGEEEV